MKVTDADRRDVHRLHEQGLSQREIARQVGISQSTVWETLRSPAPITTSAPTGAEVHTANLRGTVDRIQARIYAIETEHATLQDQLREAEIAWAKVAGWPACELVGKKYRVAIPDPQVPLDVNTGQPQVHRL